MPEDDQVELKFRLIDGTDIGPYRYSPSMTIGMLKERIITDWPRDKKIIPKTISDVKLINAGKILENNKTLAQTRTPFAEPPGGPCTMHVVVQPSLSRTKTGPSMPCHTSFFHKILLEHISFHIDDFIILQLTMSPFSD